MKKWSLTAALLCLSFAGLVHADIGPKPPFRPGPVPPAPLPPAPKVPTYPLVIEASPNVAEAKLIIPRKMLGDLKGELPLEETNPTKVAGTPRLHTIIAGSALALGLAFSGLWLVRRNQVSNRTFGLAIGGVLLLGLGAAVWADKGPRPRPAPLPPNQILPQLRSPRMNNVLIEIVDKGDSIKLVINQDKLVQSFLQGMGAPGVVPLQPIPRIPPPPG